MFVCLYSFASFSLFLFGFSLPLRVTFRIR